jgi:hypothetical protein
VSVQLIWYPLNRDPHPVGTHRESDKSLVPIAEEREGKPVQITDTRGSTMLHMFLSLPVVSDVIVLTALAAGGHLVYGDLCFLSLAGPPLLGGPKKKFFTLPRTGSRRSCLLLPAFEPQIGHFLAPVTIPTTLFLCCHLQITARAVYERFHWTDFEPPMTGVTQLIRLRGRQNRLWVLETLRRSQVRKRWRFGLNQSLIYIHPVPPLSSQFFYLSLFYSEAKKLFLVKKILGGI